MRSIDKLREYVLTAPSICSTTRAILVGYIDNIEREVEDMVPLPVDADGVPLALGDEVQTMGCEPGIVTSVEVRRDGRAFVGVLPHGWDVPTVYYADEVRHHHAPTVEDVLREFGKRWDDPAHYAKGELVETFAAKLQFKEG